jgi:hypothetical protein
VLIAGAAMVAKPKKLTQEERKELYSPIRDVNALMSKELREERVRNAMTRKLKLLLREHGIGTELKNPWLILSYVLARQYHPGFRVETEYKRGSGRPRKWGFQRQQQLLDDIDSIVTELKSKSPKDRGRWTVAAACKHASRRFPDRYRGMSSAGLAARYREAKRSLREFRSSFPDLIDRDGNYRGLLSSMFDADEN